MHLDDLKELIGYILAGLVGMVAWLGKREVSRLDSLNKDHEERIRKIEDLAINLMTAPQVMALYAEQREDHREKFRELRQDYKELRAEIGSKLDYVVNRLDHRPKNERETDA